MHCPALWEARLQTTFRDPEPCSSGRDGRDAALPSSLAALTFLHTYPDLRPFLRSRMPGTGMLP